MRKLKKPVPVNVMPEEEPEVFTMDELPVELKHEILKYLSTGFLDEVCSRVSTHWSGMVGDILNQRVSSQVDPIEPHIRSELEFRTNPEKRNDLIHLLKMHERSVLRKKFDLSIDVVTKDALDHVRCGCGLVRKLWNIRKCECNTLDECITRRIHIMPAFDLFIVQASRELKFFHINELERCSEPHTSVPREYQCDILNESTWFDNETDTDISVFQDEIVAAENSKTLLLFKLVSCNHESRVVKLEKLRRLHLPIWSRSLCLFQDKVFILYTTGYVGMWERTADDFSISPTICGNRQDTQIIHQTQLLRVGSLVFIKTCPVDSYRWHVINTEDRNLTIHTAEMAELVTAGYLQAEPPWECTEVYHIELWVNCFIVHCQVQSLVSGKSENRLLIRRIHRYPQLEDFLKKHSFSRHFLCGNYREMTRSVIVDGSVISAFLPLSLKPWQVEPPVSEPLPVCNMLALEWPTWNKRRRRKLKVYTIRITNLPRKYRRRRL